MRRRTTRSRRLAICAALAVALEVLVVVGPGAAPAAAAVGYQSDVIAYEDITASGVYHVDQNVYVLTRGVCSDSDTCTGGVRKSSGYVWFAALNVELGMGPNDHRYGLHGGIALGGSGQMNQWYADWSGYQAGGPALRDASTNQTFKPHTITNLSEGQWYRLRIWRVPCSTPDVGSQGGSGPLHGWLLAVKPLPNGVEQQAGTWCLRNAAMVSKAYSFMEIYEPSSPCTTDFWGAHFANPLFDNGSSWMPAHATGGYEPAPSCSNTNLRSPSPGYVIDERMTPRGLNGGITATGQALW